MKTYPLLLICALLPTLATAGTSLPQEVSAFISHRDGCDHFRGEEAYSPERQNEINRQVQRLCKGTDKRLQQLRVKYKNNATVLERLAHYEPQIENPSYAQR